MSNNSLHFPSTPSSIGIPSPVEDSFTPTLGQTVFTLSSTPNSDATFALYLNGQLREITTDYTFLGTTLTWLDPGGITLLTTDLLQARYNDTVGTLLVDDLWLGQGSGFYVDYLSTTKVVIRHGWREANSKIYTQAGSFATSYASSDVEVLASNIYELAPGHGLTFVVGEVLDVQGFTTAANNGKKEVSAFSGDQVTVTETLTIEAAGDSITIESIGKSHAMTSLAAGFDLHHIYIDDTASAAPNAVFIDSSETTIKPVKDTVKVGWYNGDDKSIGVIASQDTFSTVAPFTPIKRGNKISVVTARGAFPSLGSAMNPSSAFVDPNLTNTDSTTPVNAIRVLAYIFGTDSGGTTFLAGTGKDLSVATSLGFSGGEISMRMAESANVALWLSLGPSRQIQIGGENTDDNNLGAQMLGFEYEI